MHEQRESRLRRSRDDNGASAVEYGLLIAGVAALIVLIVFSFGGVIKNVFGGSCDTLKSKSGVTASCTR